MKNSDTRGGYLVPPRQPVVYRTADREYLAARQKEADVYESQRAAYNAALEKYKAEVYNPYEQQLGAYNTAAAAYNRDVYEPYKSAYDQYAAAVNAWNEGPRTTDYAGPSEPTLKPFTMSAPSAPSPFSMVAPTLPFKEEDVRSYQAEAAKRAEADAAGRGSAIEALNDPSKFNLAGLSAPSAISGMSVPGYMKGGPVMAKPPEVLTSKQMLRRLGNKVKKFADGGEAQAAAKELTSVNARIAELQKQLENTAPQIQVGSQRSRPAPFRGTSNPIFADNPAYVTAKSELDKLLEQQKVLSVARIPVSAPSTPAPSVAAPTEPPASRAPAAAPATPPPSDQYIGELPRDYTPYFPGGSGAPEFDAYGGFPSGSGGSDWQHVIPTAPPPPIPKPVPKVPVPPPPPIISNPGFMAPVEGSVNTQAFVNWVNRKTGERFLANTGGWTPPSDDWVVDNGGSPAVPAPVQRPTIRPPSFVRPSPVYTSVPVPDVPMYGRPRGDVGNIPIPDISLPGRQPEGARREPRPTGQGPAFFNPQPGQMPGTVPLPYMPTGFQAIPTALELLRQSPNLGPRTLGGPENLGYMTDRLGNVIMTPATPMVRAFADGGIAEKTAALNRMLLAEEPEDEPILTNPVGTANKMLQELNPRTTTEYSSTPKKVSMKRVSKTPMESPSGSAKGMKMELEEISAMKAPKGYKLDQEMSRADLEELAREYGLKRDAALATAKGLMRATFEKPTLEQPTLTKGSLTKRRFEEGGEVKKDDGAEEESSAPDMRFFGGSRAMPGVPEKENVREETLGMIRRLDDASVIAMANRLSGLPFESPVQARVMLEKMLGPSAVSLGVTGSGKVLPERLTGYSLGARTPMAGGEFRAGVDIPRGAGRPMFNVGYAKEFQKGGPVSKGKRPVREAPPRAPQVPQAPQLASEYTFGSEDPYEFTPVGTRNRMMRLVRSSAPPGSNSKLFSDPQITRSREEFDRLAKASKQQPLPSDAVGMFDAFVGPRGAIYASPLGGSAALTHEAAHAADYNLRGLYRQAIESRERKSNPAAQQFADAYEKLVGKTPSQEKRAEGARALATEWFDELEKQQAYRNYPPELVAFAMENAMGGDRGQMSTDRAPLHMDPTLATEFTILTDLAQKYVDSRTNKPR